MRTKHLLTAFALAAMMVPGQASATKSMSFSNPTKAGNTGKLYADANGQINTMAYKMTITNDGDEDLNPGDENYSAILWDASANVALQTIPIEETIPVGESKELTFNWDFNIAPIEESGSTLGSNGTWYHKLEVKNPFTGGLTSSYDWRDIYPYTLIYRLMEVESAYTQLSVPITFGFVSEPTTVKFRIQVTGGADMVVTSAEVPDGFTVSPEIFTIAGNAQADAETHEREISLTLGTDVTGVLAGNLVFNLDNGEQVVIPVSGSVLDENTFFESFEGVPAGTSAYDYKPTGWLFGNHWTVNDLPSSMKSDGNSYMAEHSYSDDSDASLLITPRLVVEDGQNFVFDAAKKGTYSKIVAYYSTDRSNWIPLKTITTYASDENSETFSNEKATSWGSDYKMKTYTLSGIPAGEVYIGIQGQYTRVDNFFGFKRAQVDHDFIITTSNVPVSGVINNKYTVTLSAQNLLATAEAPENYTVTLYVGGEAVATTETTEWAAGATNSFTLSFVPHKVGDMEVYAEVKAGTTVVATPVSTVNFREETSDDIIVVGTPDTSASSGTRTKIPVELYYNNSSSQTVYPAEFLAQYGLTAGTKILGVRYTVNFIQSEKSYDAAIGVRMKEVEQSTITPETALDIADIEPLNALTSKDGGGYEYNYHYDCVKANVPYDLFSVDFKEPFVYQGGNLVVMPFSEGSNWCNLCFNLSTELGTEALSIRRGNDTYSTYANASYAQETYVPVIKFVVSKDPSTLSGKVLDASTGDPVAGAEITMTSGDVIYTGVSGEDGSYSINVFQPALDYTVTIDDPNHPVLLETVSFADGSVEKDLSLQPFSENRDYQLTIKVNNATDESLAGTVVSLRNNNFSLMYDAAETVLDADGKLVINVYGGSHKLVIATPTTKSLSHSFNVNKDTEVELTLEEAVKTPYGLSAEVDHDIFTGKNNVLLTWNREAPAFFDDFESYDPFAIRFEPWTGIDGDLAAPAVMSGTYANSGVNNYGQIINPKAVVPMWDLNDYFTLAPYSGEQYLGFIQRADGNTLNDWAITPAINVGEDNKLRFYMRGADAVSAKFRVGLTTESDPTAESFTMISEGNYLSAGYETWTPVVVDLSEYAGQTVKIGFNCQSEQGSTLSMIDDVFVGRLNTVAAKMSKRVGVRSAENPNERFVITVDGVEVGETDQYEYTLADLADGDHVIGVSAKYVNASSEEATVNVTLDAADYAKLTFNVTSNNDEIPENLSVKLQQADGDAVYVLPVAEAKAEALSFPKGSYIASVEAMHYDLWSQDVVLDADKVVAVALVETLVAPFNLTVEKVLNDDGGYDAVMQWNRNLGFHDGFEDYADFSTGEFGGWKTVNNNVKASYQINNQNQVVVTFPGASTQMNPISVEPMVFNPSATTPSLGDDAGFVAPEGNKYVTFQGPQADTSDKWLISPEIHVYDNYEWSLLAKGYPIYDETFRFLISTTDNDPGSFTFIDEVKVGYDLWTQITIPLDDYAGQDVYLAVNNVTTDGFIGFIDDFSVGRRGGESVADAGNVLSYTVKLNGELQGVVTEPTYTFHNLEPRQHTAAVSATYKSGTSAETTYLFDIESGLDCSDVQTPFASVTGLRGTIRIESSVAADVMVVDMAGRAVAATSVDAGVAEVTVPAGAYLVRVNGLTVKVIVK